MKAQILKIKLLMASLALALETMRVRMELTEMENRVTKLEEEERNGG